MLHTHFFLHVQKMWCVKKFCSVSFKCVFLIHTSYFVYNIICIYGLMSKFEN